MSVYTRWTDGAGDDDLGNAANWDNGVPIDDRAVVFPGGVGGSPNVGMDQSTLDLDLIHIEAGFKGDIGASGNPWKVCADKVLHEGDGCLHYDDESTGADHTDLVVINSPNQVQAAVIDGHEIEMLVAQRGEVSVLGTYGQNIHPLMLWMSHSKNHQPAHVTVAAGAGTVATNELYIHANKVTSEVSWFRVVQTAGVSVLNTGDIIVHDLKLAGGICKYNIRDSGIGADIAACTVSGGVLDFTQDSRAVVSNGNMILLPGGTVKQFAEQMAWLSTNAQYKLGGTIKEY